MPSVENWLDEPLTIVQNIYDKYGTESRQHIKNYFDDKFSNSGTATMIPSLNSQPSQTLKTGNLVRFRCMIQDIYDHEFYLEAYELTNKADGTKSMKCGMYCDVTDCPRDYELNLDSCNNVTKDCVTLYCVPIPGESKWTKAMYGSMKQPVYYQSDAAETTKRTFDKTSMEVMSQENGSADTDATKRHKSADGQFSTQCTANKDSASDLNFPLTSESGYPCLVKVYNEIDSFKVNSMVEFVGMLSTDNPLCSYNDEGMQEDEAAVAFPEETKAKSPPTSLVPRLHAITSRHLLHNNPLLITATPLKDNELFCIREKLLDILSHALFGDRLAGEYFLCNLVSSVYSRADVVPLGKCAVNFINAPRVTRYAELLSHLISNITTQSHMLRLSLNNMNKTKFSPFKDYSTNRLRSGILQLADGTHLLLDETALEPGLLDTTGVQNVTALGAVIKWQKVSYDFSFHQEDFKVNIPVIVLSEGTSLLPTDYHVPLAPACDPTNLTAYFAELDNHLEERMLDGLRRYITLVRHLQFTMDANVQQLIQQDFVDARKESADNMTVDDFHLLLNLVRLLSLSCGSQSGSMDLWAKAKNLESQRKQRVLLLPNSTS